MALLIPEILLLIALGSAAWWIFTKPGRNSKSNRDKLLGGAAVLAGVVLSLRGAPVFGAPIGFYGLALLGIQAGGFQSNRQGPNQGSEYSAPPTSQSMSVSEAREILGVDRDAGEEEIRAAHKTLIKKLHPDAGGSAALTRQVQEARDVLLADIVG
jgi:hypothetical protein